MCKCLICIIFSSAWTGVATKLYSHWVWPAFRFNCGSGSGAIVIYLLFKAHAQKYTHSKMGNEIGKI